MIGQGYDRLMSGQMDLEEYQGLIWQFNERQKPDAIPHYSGPMPTEEQVEEMRVRTAETVSRASVH